MAREDNLWLSFRGFASADVGARVLRVTEPDAAAPVPVAGRSAELLDAAIAECVEKGYAAVGVREITERAGVSHGTFYHYFDCKRPMLTVLVERNRPAVLGRLDCVVADPPAATVEALQAAVFDLNRDVLQDIAERLDEFRFLALEVPGVDVEAFDTYLVLYREAASRFEEILGGALAVGLLHESLGIGDIAKVWLGYMLGTAAAMVSDVDVTSPAESARVVTNLLLGGARTL